MNSNHLSYTVALVQMDFPFLKRDDNLKKAADAVVEAARVGAKLVILPEGFLSGYHVGRLAETLPYAEDLEGEAYQLLSALAREHEIFILASYFTCIGGMYQNSSLLIDDDGNLVGRYAKTHLIGDENEVFTSGESYLVWDTKLGRIGCLICYDACFPETSRILALAGAEIVLVPSAWRDGHYYTQWWDLNIACRALDNLVYVAGVNRVGSCGEDTFAGHTMLCDPIGNVIAACDAREEKILYGQIDLETIKEERRNNTVLTDRRPEIYGSLVTR